MRRDEWPQWRPDSFRFAGGMNEEDSETDLKPGTPRRASNFELTVMAQPRRMGGYDRYDGEAHVPPHSALYLIVPFTAGNASMPIVGETVRNLDTGGGSAVLIERNVTSGSFAGADAVGTLILGTLGVNVYWSAAGQRIANGAAVQCGLTAAGIGIGVPSWRTAASGQVNDASYKAHKKLVEDYARSLIQPVPGSGPVRGVKFFGNVLVAWRDNAAGTACVMHRHGIGPPFSSTWIPIVFGEEVAFTAGSVAPTEGAVITQGAVTATVRRICLESGSWSGGTAAGRFVISGRAGGNFAAGALTGGGTATLSGVQTAISMNVGGRFEMVDKNFYGGAFTTRLYGCDGVNRAWEWANSGGTDTLQGVFAPIRTGMPTDVPTHIEAHRDYLFLTFASGSMQNAGVGNPFNITVRSGAAEFGLGDTPTALRSLRGSVLAIMGRDSTKLLYGTDVSTWDLKPWLQGTGAVAYCHEEVAQQAMCIDPRGAYFVEPTNAFGDFAATFLSAKVQTTMQAGAAFAKGTVRSRERGTVRVFFNDKTGLIGTFVGTKCLGWMPFTTAHQFTCFTSGENTITGEERIFAGTEDGYVMELDVGGSHDGAAIASSLRLAASNQGDPQRAKRYHLSETDLKVQGDIELTVATEIDYGADQQGGSWTETVPYSSLVTVLRVPLEGEGMVISKTYSHTSDIDDPFTLQLGRVLHTFAGIRRG